MIILATDLSQDSLQAVRWGQAYARKTSQKLRVTYVVENEFHRLPGAGAILDDPANVRKLQDEIHITLDGLVEGLEYEIDLREGHLLSELEESARDGELLVVGTNSDGFSRFALGSVPERLSHRPPIPLAVIGVRDALPEAPQWIVGVDFSKSAHACIPHVARMARSAGAALTFVHVVAAPSPVVVSNDAIMELESQSFSIKKAHEWANQRMTEFMARHEDELDAIEFDVKIVEGYPLLALEEECRELAADAILVGSTGRSALGDLLMGSVAHGLVKRMPTNVILIPT